MARPRRQVYTMQQYLDNVKEGYISNNVSTQRNPKWKPIVDGLAVTVCNDDYIPPIILAEDKSGRKVIVDGGSRTTSFVMFEKGNYKIKSSVEDPIVKYKAMEKDENGKAVWKDAEFDIRNKTFEQFPKELKKQFYEYQVETVIHECTMEEAEKYLRRYNEHTVMNANEKLFLQLPKFAEEIREIINKPFFVNCINAESITENQKEKGILERIVAESVMCMFHFDKWNKNGKKLAKYLNLNSTKEEFQVFNDNVSRLESVVTEETKILFNSKDTFIWMTAFENFKKLGFDDCKFREFLSAFVAGLKNKKVDGQLFDTVDQSGSTKDKSIISAKLHILETLMLEFLHINKEDLEEVEPIDFIRNNVKEDVDEEDMELYSMMLDDCVKVGSPVYKDENMPSLLAMIAYGVKENQDDIVCKWLMDYTTKATRYIAAQKQNYINMMNIFQKGQVA